MPHTSPPLLDREPLRFTWLMLDEQHCHERPKWRTICLEPPRRLAFRLYEADEPRFRITVKGDGNGNTRFSVANANAHGIGSNSQWRDFGGRSTRQRSPIIWVSARTIWQRSSRADAKRRLLIEPPGQTYSSSERA